MIDVDILRNLDNNGDSKARVSALEHLRSTVEDNKGKLMFANVNRLFSRFPKLLQDSSNSVIYSCTRLLCEIELEYKTPDISNEVTKIIPCLIQNLVHPKVLVRKATEDCFAVLINSVPNPNILMDEAISKGVLYHDWRIRKESCAVLVVLLRENRSQVLSVGNAITAFVGRLRDVSDAVVTSAACALAETRRIVEKAKYQTAIDSLNPSYKKMYSAVEGQLDRLLEKKISELSLNAKESTERKPLDVIPEKILLDLKNKTDDKVKAAAAEALQAIVSSSSDSTLLVPYLQDVIGVLVGLAHDVNPKLKLLGLHIAEDLI
jgi:hypothetical protein